MSHFNYEICDRFAPIFLRRTHIILLKLQYLVAIWLDPPLGNMVFWRGFSRLTDITLGFSLGKDACG
ncbi:hypothetical protein [Leptospira noguchii]|uniref:hypothetical protein n=1 Tax=Leptospira noguchii TaxID=28182 RepID=UPI0002F055E8|nr:hypothetical protein [Leptospira noguchii]